MVGVCAVAAFACFVGYFASLGSGMPWLTDLVAACGITAAALMAGALVRRNGEQEPEMPRQNTIKCMEPTRAVQFPASIRLGHISEVSASGTGTAVKVTTVSYRAFTVVHTPICFEGPQDCLSYSIDLRCPFCGQDFNFTAKGRRVYLVVPKSFRSDNDPRRRKMLRRWLRLRPSYWIEAMGIVVVLIILWASVPNFWVKWYNPMLVLGESEGAQRLVVLLWVALWIATAGVMRWRAVSSWVRRGRPILFFARGLDKRSVSPPSLPHFYLEQVVDPRERSDHRLMGPVATKQDGLYSKTVTGGTWMRQKLGFRPLNMAWQSDYENLYVWSDTLG